MLKGVIHFRNGTSLYAAATAFREVYKTSQNKAHAKDICIKPVKYGYKCSILLEEFIAFLEQHEGRAVANCGFVRPSGEWSAILNLW